MSRTAKVLILSHKEDLHARTVAGHLEELGASVDYFRYSELNQSCSVSFALGTTSSLCSVARKDDELDLRSYGAIWHRRPGVFMPGRFVEPWIAEMVEKETRDAFVGILRTLPCLWVNFPINDYAASSKLWQLQLAERLGLSIPETLVTSNPGHVSEFFEKCGGEVIYKLLCDQSGFSIPRGESPAGIPTLPLRKEDLPFLSQVAHSAHFFQKRIKKHSELRATIIGRELFCVSIDSQSGRSKVDWRNDYSVEMKPFELPEDVKAKCFALMRRLGLNYGAIDLILTPDGQYVFLEMNVAGQYLWAEQRTSLPISLALARLLARETEPLVHEGVFDG